MTNARDTALFWHAIYGYLNFNALRELDRKKMVHGLPRIDHIDQLCDVSLVGKQRRVSFPSAATFRADKPLALVHADLCGPISPPTPAGNRYFLLVADDYSRYMWLVLLKSKDQVLSALHKTRKEQK